MRKQIYKKNDMKKYQLEMLQRGVIKNLVEFNILGNKIKMNIENLKSLKKTNIIKELKIMKIIKQSRRHLLDEGNFSIDKVYIDNENEIKLLYIPKKNVGREKIIDKIISKQKNKYVKDFIRKYYDAKEDKISKFILKYIDSKKKWIGIYFLIYLILITLVRLINLNYGIVIVTLAYALLSAAFLFERKEKRETDINELLDDEKTVVLNERKGLKLLFSDPYGNEKELFINECETKYIGRDHKKCDLVIENRTVGRNHAQITYVKEKILIKDNESLNNTYLNNSKLKGNKLYEICTGDKVQFADEEYMVCLQK